MRPFLCVFILAFAVSAFGADQSATPQCTGSTSSMDLFKCIVQSHPTNRSAQINRDIAKANRDQITQFANPALSLRSVRGESAGDSQESTEIGVAIDVTGLLIKRSAINAVGRTEERVQTVAADEEIFKAQIQVVKDLVRYRQIGSELELTNEALQTFAKISSQYRGRKALGPDQQITLNLVELAQSDYLLRKNHLTTEKLEIETRYKSIFGSNFELKKEVLPDIRKAWPEINAANVSTSTFALRRAEAQSARADAQKRLANAESWPTIAAGPALEKVTNGNSSYTANGFNVNVSLPLFNQNGGGRDLAEKNRLKANLELEYSARSAELEKQLLIQKYQTAVEALKKSASDIHLSRTHNQIDNFFRGGLTSGTVVIEAHRQILEFTESQHEHELTALDSLMYINLLSGKKPEEVLK